MRSIIAKLLWTVVMTLFGASCSPATTPTVQPTPSELPGASFRTLTIDQFADILANQSDTYTIVNVHIPYEGEVAGTDLKIPYNDIDALTRALPDKNAPIILYCRSGRMSEQASRALVGLGYTQVWDIPGGMNAWVASGHPLILANSSS